MADQLYLSYKLRGYTEVNMLRHYETMLRHFPFSRLAKGEVELRIVAVSFHEPPVLDHVLETPDVDGILEAARHYQLADCAVQVEAKWDLWQYEDDWKLAPARVVLMCFGPQFEDAEDEHLRIDFGIDSNFLPQPELPNQLFMVQSNVKSLLHLVHDIDNQLNVELRRLWTESGENFAEKLEAAVR